jgi:hypothetical protein
MRLICDCGNELIQAEFYEGKEKDTCSCGRIYKLKTKWAISAPKIPKNKLKEAREYWENKKDTFYTNDEVIETIRKYEEVIKEIEGFKNENV